MWWPQTVYNNSIIRNESLLWSNCKLKVSCNLFTLSLLTVRKVVTSLSLAVWIKYQSQYEIQLYSIIPRHQQEEGISFKSQERDFFSQCKEIFLRLKNVSNFYDEVGLPASLFWTASVLDAVFLPWLSLPESGHTADILAVTAAVTGCF